MNTIEETKETTKNLIVGFIGLPSAGKSTMINALSGYRILRSGVRRTTKDIKVIGNENIFDVDKDKFVKYDLVSDDDIHFTAIDLPGVADLENKEEEVDFDKMTLEWCIKCDIIFWISDIKTAFLTKHEKKEFDKVMEILQKHSLETGKLHRVGIILSKSDYDRNIVISNEETQEEITDVAELSDDEEETTVRDTYKYVLELFEDKYIISEFNSLGRIQHGNCSPSIKKFYAKVNHHSPNINTEFYLNKMVGGYDYEQQECILGSIISYHFKKFMNERIPQQGRTIMQCNRDVNNLNQLTIWMKETHPFVTIRDKVRYCLKNINNIEIIKMLSQFLTITNNEQLECFNKSYKYEKITTYHNYSWTLFTIFIFNKQYSSLFSTIFKTMKTFQSNFKFKFEYNIHNYSRMYYLLNDDNIFLQQFYCGIIEDYTQDTYKDINDYGCNRNILEQLKPKPIKNFENKLMDKKTYGKAIYTDVQFITELNNYREKLWNECINEKNVNNRLVIMAYKFKDIVSVLCPSYILSDDIDY